MTLALKEIHPVSHATERQLVRAVREGDDRAFEQLFSRYRRRITGYVHGLVNDHGRAEDITQEVFISALRRLRETEGAISFKPWIYEIARNACIDEFRRMSRASVISLDLDADPDSPPPIQLADYTTPEMRWESKQQIGDLFGAFSSLPGNQHRILVLRELEGLSYGEIGAQMGMSRPMVESTLFRARRRLSQEYDELASGRRCLDVQGAVDRQDVRAIATLGVRERRRIARHLHHCSDCLRYARMAGVDDSVLSVPGPARRVAALLPFGWLRLAWHRARGKAHGHTGARSGHGASNLASASPQGLAVGKAAAAAAALLITGGSAATFLHAQSTARGATAVSLVRSPGVGTELAGAPFGAGTPSRTSARRTAATPSAATIAGQRSAAQTASAGSGASRSAPPTGARASSPPATSASSSPTQPVATPRGGALATLPRTPLGTVVSKSTAAVSGVVSKLPSTVGTVVSQAPSAVNSVLNTAPRALGSGVTKVPSVVGGVVNPVPGAVGGAVNKAPSTAGGIVNTVPGPVGGVVNKVPGGLSGIGSSTPTHIAAPSPPAPVSPVP